MQIGRADIASGAERFSLHSKLVYQKQISNLVEANPDHVAYKGPTESQFVPAGSC